MLSVSHVTDLLVSVSGTDLSQLNLAIQLHCCLAILTSSSELSPVKISSSLVHNPNLLISGTLLTQLHVIITLLHFCCYLHEGVIKSAKTLSSFTLVYP